MVGQFIPHDDENFLVLLEILDLLLAPEITEDETASLESLILNTMLNLTHMHLLYLKCILWFV